MENKPKRRRPGRPRSTKTRAAILTATLSLIAERGVPAVTIEAVAAAAGVGKPTIYRYWANAHELAMTALMETAPALARDEKESPLKELRSIFHRMAATFGTPTGRYVATMLAAADENSEVAKAFRSHFIQTRRREAASCLEQARGAGLIPADSPVDILLDMLFGAVFYRLLMGGAPLTEAYMDQLLDAGLTRT